MEGRDCQDERPLFDSGEVVHSENGDFAFRIEDLIGEGRCCLVYSGHAIRDNTRVALKFFKRGKNYEGALQRELGILNMFKENVRSIVTCYGYFRYKGLHCQVMEYLEFNVREAIFKNDRQGLDSWGIQKFCSDILSSLSSLHARNFVHADLKPANIMWSANDCCFKLLDFGLTYHTGEKDVHQIQTKGYQAPESSTWNLFKQEKKQKRKRRMQGTFSDLTKVGPAFNSGLNRITKEEDKDTSDVKTKDEKQWPSQSSGIYTASEYSQHETSPPITSSGLRKLSRATLDDDTSDFSSEVTSVQTISRRNSVATSNGGTTSWRRSDAPGKKRRPGDIDQGAPERPGLPIDMWSFGCLLFEVVTGSKLFRAGDKLVSVLKADQLVEMKIGETEIKFVERNEADLFHLLKNIILKCLKEEPKERISASEALNHEFLQKELTPSVKDKTLFPTNSLTFLQVLKGSKDNQDILERLKEKAKSYGPVTRVQIHGENVCVEFQEASDCQEACCELSGSRLTGHTLIPIYSLNTNRINVEAGT